MILNDLKKKFSSIKDIALIGKEIVTADKLCEVMGFYLCGRTLQLVLLEYDDKRMEHERQQEKAHSNVERTVTNRIEKCQQIQRGFNNSILSCINEIVIDDVSYQIEQSGATRVMLSDYENTLLLSRFFEKGWKPQNIGKTNIENCFLCTGTFCGKFKKIPKFNSNSKIIFKFTDDQKAQIVEQPITLEVGKEYSEKIYFTAKDTGEEHWVCINSVSVYDMFTETMKKFENPKWTEQYSEKEGIQMKMDLERSILEICPKGKGFLSIEYESDCDQQIAYYSKEWLDSEPIHRNSTTSFIARAGKKTGKIGRYLRVAHIEKPLELNIKSVEAEIFVMFKSIKSEDIVL